MSNERINKRQNRVEIIKEVLRLIDNGEMTREKLGEMKDMIVAPRCTVGGFIESSMDFESFKWEDGKIVRVHKIEIKLDFKTQKSLKNKITETGLSEKELIIKLIQKE